MSEWNFTAASRAPHAARRHLTRSEAQFDLASANIGLVSHLLDDALLDGGATMLSSARELEN